MDTLTIAIAVAVLAGGLYLLNKSNKKDDKKRKNKYKGDVGNKPEDTTVVPPVVEEDTTEPDSPIDEDWKPPVNPETGTGVPEVGPKPIPEVKQHPVPEVGDLANFKTARRKKVIDLSNMKALNKTLSKAQLKIRKGDQLYKFNEKAFVGAIAKTSRFSYAVLYLCDSTGKVYDIALSAPGAEERKLVYTPDMFEGVPYIYSASNTAYTNATIRPTK